MKFAEFVCTEAIRAEHLPTDKQGVIGEWRRRSWTDKSKITNSIVKAILKREEFGSTGIGRGAAIPHTHPPGVGHTVAAAGVNGLPGEGRQKSVFVQTH